MIAQYTLELRNGLPSLVTEKIHYISEKGYINSETVIQLLNDTLRPVSYTHLTLPTT